MATYDLTYPLVRGQRVPIKSGTEQIGEYVVTDVQRHADYTETYTLEPVMEPAVHPAQIPQTLMEPAMNAGHPPDLLPEGAKFTRQGGKAEYASVRRDDLDPADITAAINRMAAQGWRLVTFDGERYIFERAARDATLHER